MKSMFSRFKKPPEVPDRGQRVRLLMEDGRWAGGYRAASEPVTGENGEGAIWVAEEVEFRVAQWEERIAEGELWPISKVKVPKNHQRYIQRRLKKSSKAFSWKYRSPRK